MIKHLFSKMMVFFFMTSIFVFCPQIHAVPLSELWNSGEVNGLVSAFDYIDVDKDGVDDILCLQQDSSSTPSVTSFKVVRGEAFTDLYPWVTTPGDLSGYYETVDIDQNGSYETIIVSISNVSTNQYQVKIIIYDTLTGTQIWESETFSITSVIPFFSGFPSDLIGTSDYEWVITINEKDPSTLETTGKVMVYRKDTGGVGFSQLLWEETYPGGTVTTSCYYDLNRDGKINLQAGFIPDQGSTSKGAVIYYQPSGSSSFTELVRFEASQPGNTIGMIYTQSSTKDLYPTRVDHGVTGGNLLFEEIWVESGQWKFILYAYRADAPYNQIGTYNYEGEALSLFLVYPDDYDGDGWDELTLLYYDQASQTSNLALYTVQGGNFTLNKIWETEDTSGIYLVPHWDINQDNKADLCIVQRPSPPDTTSYGTLTFYQWTGSTFSPLYQFTSSFPGYYVGIGFFASYQQRVAGPTEYLFVPVDLDCSPGKDLALINLTTSPYEYEGKITVYNLPSQSISWESQIYDSMMLMLGGSIVNVQSVPSNDLLLVANKMEMVDSTYGYKGSISVLSCGQSTDTTTTTTGSPTTSIPIQPCPVVEIYGEYSEETELLRYLRDNVLSNTPEGQEIIKLYYELSPAIVKMMNKDEEFREKVKSTIDGILPLIESQIE